MPADRPSSPGGGETESTEYWRRLAAVFEQAPALIAVLRGPEHVFEIANPPYLELVGRRDLIGKPVREALPELVSQGFVELLDRVRETGEPYVGREVPVELPPVEGAARGERYFDFVYQPLRDGRGAVEGIISHGVEVTEQVEARRRAEEQAAELEWQAEELQNQSAQLEETQAELEAQNDELARATAAAEEAHLRLAAVLQQMPSGVLVAEAPSGRVVVRNDQVQRIWRNGDVGVAERDDRGRYRGFHPDGRPYEAREWPLQRSLRGERVMDEEISIVRGDGTRGVISLSSAPIRDAAGEVVAAVAVFDDVTERAEQEAEQAFLVEAARFLASSLDYQETLGAVARLAVPRIADWCAVDVLEGGEPRRLAVVHTDPEKEELAREVARRWPDDPDATTGVRNVLRVGQPELYSEIPEELLRAGARDEEHLRVILELGLRSAMILPMLARGRTLGAITFISAESGRRYDEHDLQLAEKLASRAAMAVDNARLYAAAQRAREEAEQARHAAEAASRSKSDFLANMSHEMRTPLNAVIGYTDLLEMGIAGAVSERQASYLSRVRTSTEHLLGLINDILDLARVEAGRMEVRQEVSSVTEAVASALALLGPQAVERGVEVRDECAGASATSYVGDADRVRQILVNIVGNAVKFTDGGGVVTVSCGTAPEVEQGTLWGEKGPWTYVRVQDTGIGIAPDQLERIFRPFEQAQGGYTREAGGTGLGLSISRQFALLMGGDVTVVSTPGEGSAFTLWLPTEVAYRVGMLTEIWRDERPRGLAEAGDALLREVDGILARYRAALRREPLLPRAATLGDAELEDHQSSFLSDIAATLIALERAGELQQQPLLRDSGEIQRVVSELHGRQRAHLEWTEAGLRRDFEILRQEVRVALERALAGSGADPGEIVPLVHRLIGRGERISLRAFRVASSGTAGGEPR